MPIKYKSQYAQPAPVPEVPHQAPPTDWSVAIFLVLVLLALAATAKWWWPPLRQNPARSVGAILLVLGSGLCVGGILDSDSAAAVIGTMMLVSGFLLFRKEKTA